MKKMAKTRRERRLASELASVKAYLKTQGQQLNHQILCVRQVEIELKHFKRRALEEEKLKYLHWAEHYQLKAQALALRLQHEHPMGMANIQPATKEEMALVK